MSKTGGAKATHDPSREDDAALPEIDPHFVSRLLLGALSDHEQRRLAVRLAESDAEVRSAIAAHVADFQMRDRDLAHRFEEALGRGEGEGQRSELLARSRVRTPDLDETVADFTFEDVFRLGETTRRFFTWSTAEHLLERALRPERTPYEARSSLQLALLVTDVVELLGAVGQAPRLPALVADLRARIDRAADALEAR